MNFLIDLTGTDLLLSDEIALHWGFTCANDVIEGAYSVPEPGIMNLLGIGTLLLSLHHMLTGRSLSAGNTPARSQRPKAALLDIQ